MITVEGVPFDPSAHKSDCADCRLRYLLYLMEQQHGRWLVG
jgi:hypothetical protein